MYTVNVPVKPASASKINWTQIASILAVILAYFGLDVSPEVLVTVIAGIAAAGDVLTLVLRTFFTRSITSEAVGK